MANALLATLAVRTSAAALTFERTWVEPRTNVLQYFLAFKLFTSAKKDRRKKKKK
jgi:hypothetical protein